jgi:ethanolamine utilization protein EutA
MRSRLVQLIGLDFGSTTCSAVVAEARLTEHCATGRRELEQAVTRYRSALVMTPFVGQTEDVLDLEAVARAHRRLAARGGSEAETSCLAAAR